MQKFNDQIVNVDRSNKDDDLMNIGNNIRSAINGLSDNDKSSQMNE